MSDDSARVHIGGAVGERATVLIGEYLTNIAIQPKNVDDAIEILRFVEKQRAKIERPGLPRQLLPDVFVNRWQELEKIQDFFEDKNASILYVFGIAAIGKSVLVRGALELAHTEIPVVWVNCRGLDIERLLLQMNTGFRLEVQDLLRNPKDPVHVKISTVLAAIKDKRILVFDELESLLDDKENYQSEAIETLMEAICTLEHKLKVLVTTRRLPQNVNEASAGVQIVRLPGFSNEKAKDHFIKSADKVKLSPEKRNAALETKSFEKIQGHPFFLELLASTLRDLPVKEVDDALLISSDIGEYITNNALKGLSADELGVFQVAAIFRSEFTFKTLHAVYNELNKDAKVRLPIVRALIRQNLLETIMGEQTAYYIHPLLREAVPWESNMKADAHSATARWFLGENLNTENFENWDAGLYHLRQAAEIKRDQETFDEYKNYLIENNIKLVWAGWGRRIIDELIILNRLAKNEIDKIIILYHLGAQLHNIGELSEALTILRDLNNSLPQLDTLSQEEKKLWYLLYVAIKTQLGNTLAMMRNVDEAKRVAEEIDPLIDFIDDPYYKCLYSDLRFSIERQSEQPDTKQMLYWANEYYKLAEQEYEKSPSIKTSDTVAEAHFKLAVTYLRLEDFEKMSKHLLAQLHIKIDIGKIPGIAAGLFNVGTLFSVLNPEFGGVLFLSWEQISLEIREAIVEDESRKTADEMITQFLGDRNNLELGRQLLHEWKLEKILPYYERALKRRLG